MSSQSAAMPEREITQSSDGTSNANKRKRTSGRQKIDMEPIQRQAARQVCFSKRRSGLFKKASELSILCGAHVAVIVFSPAMKPFSFIHPSSAPMSVLDRYLFSQSSQPHHDHCLQLQGQQLLSRHASTSDTALPDLCSRLTELTDLLKDAKSRKEALVKKVHALSTLEGNVNVCVDGDMSRLGRTELDYLKMQLERVKEDISIRADEFYMDGISGTGVPSSVVYGYGYHSACDEFGGMLLPASLASVSDYVVLPQMPANCPFN